MKKLFKNIVLLLICAVWNSMVFAQSRPPVEMADVMRSNGKIYIVVAICLTILIGLFLYVWSVDRKISKLEKE
jgi:protein-S-isoprenylcysteine O-methyltransferase Ste14